MLTVTAFITYYFFGNRSAMSSTAEILDDDHYSFLRRAVGNVLDTSLALATYRQIIDGLPTKDVAWDRSRHKLQRSHPIVDHKQLCPGVEEKLKSIKAEFNIDSIRFDPNVSFVASCHQDYRILI